MNEQNANRLREYYPDYERLLEEIIDNLPLPISVIGKKDCRFALVNKIYEKTFGKPRSEMLGKDYFANVKPGEISVHQPVLELGKPCRKAKIMGTPTRTVSVDGIPIFIDGELVCSVGVIHEFHHIERIMSELEKRQDVLRDTISDSAKFSFDDLIGSSAAQKKTILSSRKAAETDVTVLLRGETGTGKEMYAHAIHNASTRKCKPFLRVNCAAIPESLLESILFGYEPGAFTGAKKTGEVGIFEAADKGTIFLDEIGDLSPILQSRLLRVLQEGEIIRVGGIKPKIVDVRIIAATNADLEEKIRQKEFRSDLYYRLNVFPINIAPLRERKEDIKDLAEYFLKNGAAKYGKSVAEIKPEVFDEFNRYDWPGNIRELEHLIERAVIGMPQDKSKLALDDLDFFTHSPGIHEKKPDGAVDSAEEYTYKEMFENWESAMLKELYEKCGKNKTALAARLGISVRSVYDKLNKYEIE